MSYTVAAFYRFTPIADPASLCGRLHPIFAAWGLCGSLLVAPEGVNGTLAGSSDAVEKMLQQLHAVIGLQRDEVKFSSAAEKPFNRLKIRLKKEIITFRQPTANPNHQVGTYVPPKDWNRLLADPDVVVLDTRNTYETAIGTFAGAVVPPIDQFTQLADFVRNQMGHAKHKKIAMFCTGGIRCEKASAFMMAEGFEQVYHLQGGILKYLEVVAPEASKWRGDCYVFDRRVAVGHGLTTSPYSQCFCCGDPLSEQDRLHPAFEAGVSCHRCIDKTSADDKARFRARHQRMTQPQRGDSRQLEGQAPEALIPENRASETIHAA
ncbi:MAG: rhodanese-related sulfurtransferase [Alphaproteobacteria bacterium]|nr:rhodanese-related sulfurtransferase [Alphaproteobacteria bacterium]